MSIPIMSRDEQIEHQRQAEEISFGYALQVIQRDLVGHTVARVEFELNGGREHPERGAPRVIIKTTEGKETGFPIPRSFQS